MSKIAKLGCELAIPKLMSGLGTSVKKCPNSISFPEPAILGKEREALG